SGLTLHDTTNESNFTLTLTPNNTTAGEEASSASQTIDVTVNPAPETPTLALAATTASVAEAGGSTLLPTITLTAVDADDVLTLTVAGLPTGATITDGNGNTYGGPCFTTPPSSDLSGLTLHDTTNESNFT